MAVRRRPVRAVKPRGSASANWRNRVYAFLGLAMAAFVSLTSGAEGPGFGPIAPVTEPEITASLTYQGTDVFITGSVGEMFRSAMFVGPNRAMKQNRPRPEVDVLALARSFQEVRIRLAAQRGEVLDDPEITAQSTVLTASAGGEKAAEEEGPRISVASIDPAAGVEALKAISEAAPEESGPVPVIASEQLAYARANAPVTEQPKPRTKTEQRQAWCLATAIYFEARGESYRGQVAVAQVVMNRVKHSAYPSTICSVVFQNQHRRNACQFSFACDGIPERVTETKAWAQAQDIADKVIDDGLYLSEVGRATHYHASYVYPHWAPRLKRVTKIGLHIFYRFKSS